MNFRDFLLNENSYYIDMLYNQMLDMLSDKNH